MSNSTKKQASSFAIDVDTGLSSFPKYLSSKYFYDAEGSRLFQEITKLPEYYLTRSELEIFTENGDEISRAFNAGSEPFDLVELGAGDGTKTSVLVRHLLGAGADFRFVPIDISRDALGSLTENFRAEFPGLEIRSENGDYLRTLETFRSQSARKKVLLFLGSNIGNFSEEQALDFFRGLRESMDANDLLLVGFDLHKNPKTILNAYDDSHGITRLFNLNLLRRINRELDADFDIDSFSHYASYHPLERAARSFLISMKDQTVTIGALEKSFEFELWEPVFMEISQKYDLRMIESLAEKSGFEVISNFFDEHRYYTDSLWRPVRDD